AGFWLQVVLRQQRVARVKLLLNHTSMSLVEIALACGFSSQSQMTMHFRKATGTTPKKYRNQS
ncbi:MAG: helix-turn-helix domain-containing protein, partial [Cyanobacteria bacterium J06598_4]